MHYKIISTATYVFLFSTGSQGHLQPKYKRVQFVLRYSYTFVHIQPMFPLLLYIQEPFGPKYWPRRFHKFVHDTSHLKPIILIVTGIFDYLSSVQSLFPVGFIVAMLMVYFAVLNNWLENLTKIAARTSFEALVRNYRILQIFNQIGRNCFSGSTLPVLYSLSYWLILTLVVVYVKVGSKLVIVNQVNFLGAFALLLFCVNAVIKAGGTVLWKSQQTLNLLRKRRKEVYHQKVCRACAEVRIYFNSVFYFERNTFTVFLNSMINNVITIVLAI